MAISGHWKRNDYFLGGGRKPSGPKSNNMSNNSAPSPSNSSKIDCLFQQSVDSIVNIVPEKNEEVKKYIQDYQIKFVINDFPGFQFTANTKNQEISISRHSLEIIWVHSYYYWVVYQEARMAQLAGKRHLNLNDSESGKKAIELMSWLDKYSQSKWTLGWPDNLPQPSLSPKIFSDEHVANELMLVSVAFCLHHELNHIIRQHGVTRNNSLSRREEKEADIDAVQYILTGATEPDIYQKRMLGIAISMLFLTSLGIQSGRFDDTSHPKAITRLFDCVDSATLDDNHLIFAFCANTLKMYMDTHGVTIESTEDADKTIKDLFHEYLVEISRQVQ
jgi:hypothetical protein